MRGCGVWALITKEPLETKRYIAYIPEQVTLYKNLSWLENLEYFSALAGHEEYSREQLFRFFEEVGLQREAADNRVSTYSKGMRQKVGIAIALAKKAEALLLDEPTSGLDPKASNEFSALLNKLSGQGVAVLMATHDLFRAKESSTRVGIRMIPFSAYSSRLLILRCRSRIQITIGAPIIALTAFMCSTCFCQGRCVTRSALSASSAPINVTAGINTR
jgi:hypothetical protein